ncbi:MAG: enoyl-CoA hydratase-related protein [Gemmatimonadales bacterium]
MSDSTPFQALRVETTAGIATVTLNRPESRNALEPGMFAELARALRGLDDRDDVRAIVLTGAGRDFCAGADLGSGNAVFTKEAFEEFEQLSSEAGGAPAEHVDVDPQRLLTPVIAAVNGTAAGGGLTLALQCDIVIVAEDATLALPFVRRGLVAERNAHWILPRLVGTQRSLELLLTGRKFDGREAARMGWALRAVPRDAVLEEALTIAREIADHAAPVAAAATKRLIYSACRQADADVARLLEREIFQELGASKDCREGVDAYRERRAPRWQLAKREIPAKLRGEGTD